MATRRCAGGHPVPDTTISAMMDKLGITELRALIKFAVRYGSTPRE
jgi:hypothetical protein